MTTPDPLRPVHEAATFIGLALLPCLLVCVLVTAGVAIIVRIL